MTRSIFNKYFFSLILLFSFYENYSQSEYWLINYDEAIEFADKENQSVLLVFAGSDWCRPCMIFKKEILLSTLFQDYASSHFQVLYLDFPSKKKNQLSVDLKKQNETLAERYNSKGIFPRLVLLNPKTEKFSYLDYSGEGAEHFISLVKAINK